MLFGEGEVPSNLKLKVEVCLFAISAQSAVPHVSIDSEVLKFGYCVPNQLSESKV